MSEQIRIKFLNAELAEQEFPQLLELVRQAADAHQRKEVCHELDISRSVLDNILADRDRHALKARHLLYFLLIDNSGQILRKLAEMTGHQVLPKKPLTAQQKVRAYEDAIRRRLGPLGDEILAEALKGVA